MRRKCIIVDVDGTIANGEHRQHWVRTKPKNWMAFNKTMHLDGPIWPVIDLIHILQLSVPIIVCSGREIIYKEVTEKWLEQYNIYPEHLYMRPKADYRDDTIIKEEFVKDIQKNYDILGAFDDRVKVVDHYRKLGIFVFDVNQTREIF